jgi:hypothetical protein
MASYCSHYQNPYILWELWYFVRDHRHELISWELWYFVRGHRHEVISLRVIVFCKRLSSWSYFVRVIIFRERAPPWKSYFVIVSTTMKITQKEHLNPNSNCTHVVQMSIQHTHTINSNTYIHMQLIPTQCFLISTQLSNHYIKRVISASPRLLAVQKKFHHILSHS